MSDMKLTSAGFNLVAQALAGHELTFTRVVFGDAKQDGSIVTPAEDERLALTNLINPHDLALPITDIRPGQNGSVTLTFLIDNARLSNGFYCREVGIFAKIDEGAEQLYAYLYNDEPQWIPAISEETWRIYVSVAITVENALNVTAILDMSQQYVLNSDFYDHVADPNPHPNSPHVEDNISAADFIWATTSDNNLHKLPLNNLAEQILGETTTLDQLNGRVNQTEINIANLFLQLKAQNELGLNANLLMVEDFNQLDCCDLFKVQVIVAIEGVDDLEVSSLEGIRAGSWYQLSDGIRSELVRVKAVAKNTDKYVATLYDTIKETYDLTATYLYRSSVLTGGGQALGAGTVRNNRLAFNSTWQGSSANQSQLITLNTTQSNSDAFDLEGNAAFDANGFFTLA